MADRMDALLDAIGKEANAEIDFEAALAGVLAKAQAAEEAHAKKPARIWARPGMRYLSMAAGMVLLLGAAVLLGRGFMLPGDLSGAPAPEAAPQLAMAPEGAAAPAEGASPADTAQIQGALPAPAAFAAPTEPGGGMALMTEDIFYGSAAITVPAAGLPRSDTGLPKTKPAEEAAREESLLNGSHDAYDAEGGICMIGQADRLLAQGKLQEAGYNASFSSDAHVDQLAMLQPGEACIANAGEIGVWNTGSGFLTLNDPALGQREIYDILLGAVA